MSTADSDSDNLSNDNREDSENSSAGSESEDDQTDSSKDMSSEDQDDARVTHVRFEEEVRRP